MNINQCIAALCKKFRAGTITATELKQLDELEAQHEAVLAAQPQPPPPRTIFDLPMAAVLWKLDARSVES